MQFLIREANSNDFLGLIRLSHFFPLCSLPKSKIEMEKRIHRSELSFRHKIPQEERVFLFVLEDLKEKKILASSQILSYFDPACSLCYFLEKDHLKLEFVTEGRHQIGGLILDPSYRQSPYQFGLQIGAVRFLYMKYFQQNFSDKIEVSLTAPIDGKKNPFWQNTGSKILNLNYEQALQSFQKDRLQFFSMFPKHLKIPLKNLSLEAKSFLTEIHKQTLPVYKGLLKRGFVKSPRHHVLDGGIYLEAYQKDISFIKGAQFCFLKKTPGFKKSSLFLVGQNTAEGFFCSQLEGEIKEKILYLKTIPKKFELEKQAVVLKFPI